MWPIAQIHVYIYTSSTYIYIYTSSTRILGGAEVAKNGYTIRPFSSCVRRAPRPNQAQACVLCAKVMRSSKCHTWNSTLHSSNSTLHTPHFISSNLSISKLISPHLSSSVRQKAFTVSGNLGTSVLTKTIFFLVVTSTTTTYRTKDDQT